MPDQPPDLTVRDVVRTAGPMLAEVPKEITQFKKSLDAMLSSDYLGNSPDGAQFRAKIAAIRSGLDAGLVNATEAAEAAQKLLKEFAFPLAIVGGVRLEGSGVLAKDVTGALQGLKTSMTRDQKIIRTIYGIIAVLAGAGVTIAGSLQQGTIVSPQAGAGIIAVCSGVKEILAVLNAAYKGFTGSDLNP